MSRGRILVVDDEIYIVHILDFSLGMEGYEVVTALDGEEGLAKAIEFKPDLVVLDIMMPKMDGSEVAADFMNDREFKRTPLIFLTALVTNQEVKNSSVSSAKRTYLPKPINWTELVDAIQAVRHPVAVA